MIKESIIEKITLPKDWKMLPFGDVCEISGGSQPPKPTFIYEPKEGYIRLVQVRDYRTNNFITYIPKEKAKKFCNKTDIMIGRYGPPIFGIFRGLEGAYNVALMKAIPNKELLNQEYLYWFLKTDSLVKFVEKSSKRAAGQDGVRKEVLYTYPTPIPPLPQQKQIVAILDKAFAAIDTAKTNAEQNLQNAKELFESYLQNVFENKGDDWAEYELSEIVDKRCSLSYGIVQPGNEFPNGLPVIRPTNMKNKFVYPLGLKLIDPTKAESYKRTSLVGDELLLCVRGETGVTSLITDELKGANVTRGIVPVCFDSEKLSLPFGYYLFVSPFVQKQIKDKTYGAALMQINIRDVRKLLVRIPSKKEQEEIVQKLDALSAETKKLEAIYIQKIADLEEMKKSVLQKAFSGQLNTIN